MLLQMLLICGRADDRRQNIIVDQEYMHAMSGPTYLALGLGLYQTVCDQEPYLCCCGLAIIVVLHSSVCL